LLRVSAGFCSLEGRLALVTGASRGIGRAIAVELARAGAEVVVGYRSGGEEAEAVAAEIGGRAVQADVSDLEQAAGLVEEAGAIGFTKALARELASRNVRVNAIAPGYIETALTEVLPDGARNALLAGTPLGRLGAPEDVAGAVRFLCSDEASFITGEVLLVDGGLGM